MIATSNDHIVPAKPNSQKINLFVDCRWLLQPAQGVYTYLSEVYRRLKSEHNDAFQFIYGCVGDIVPDFCSLSDRILTYTSDTIAWRYFSLGKSINEHQIDIAHFQYYLPRGLRSGVKSVVTIHDILFMREQNLFPATYRFSRKFLFSDAAKRSNGIITISEQTSDDLVRFFKIEKRKIELIHLGMDTELSTMTPKPVPDLTKSSYILTVGRHEPRKNYGRLIEAYVKSNIFPKMGTKLVIAGWYPRQFQQQKLTAPGVILLPDCHNAEIAWLYRHAKGFVFPSIAEGSGLPLAEALSFGIPVAVSHTYPIPLLKTQAKFVFDPYSIPEMVRTLEEMGSATSETTPTITPASWTWDHCATAHRNMLIDLANLR